ncbi:MAG: glycoside hydrolase family 127 protein [Butyrivibrio sp.]|nr:glycoside hydrolase family 127 protein [Butyrivibrio sp.]
MVSLRDVTITDAYYREAMERTVDNMLQLDADRLLAGFRETAGCITGMNAAERVTFMRGKTRYGGGWEDGLIGGHTLGHYLTALAQAQVNPGLDEARRTAVRERLEEILTALKECQEMTEGTPYAGYIFGGTLPGLNYLKKPDLQFDYVEKGMDDLYTQSWVPWYTMHKILTGLNNCYEIAGREDALVIANRLGTWIAARTESWSDARQQTVLSIEYGGMNDCLYQLYVINRHLAETGSPLAVPEPERFMTAAHRFDEVALFEAVLEHPEGVLNGKHANTTIPKFLGAIARYEADPSETRYLEYAQAFWQLVVDHHTYVTGGNSENEHFGADDCLNDERTHVNNETCNTHNMLKLSRRLFLATGDRKYADYYEKTIINAILASQNHDTGLTMYFQPMATGYHKVFSTLDTNFWCCTGTGYENFTKLQEGIYECRGDRLYINRYVASGISLESSGFTLRQEGDLTQSDTMQFTVHMDDRYDGQINMICLRIPEWTNLTPVVTITGKVSEAERDRGYLLIPIHTRELSFSVRLPMSARAHALPDAPHTIALTYGPFVLSARLGTTHMSTKSHGVAVTVPAARAVSSDTLLVTGTQSAGDYIDTIGEHLVREPGTMEFRLLGVDVPLTFTSHYNQYTESYGIYWTIADRE